MNKTKEEPKDTKPTSLSSNADSVIDEVMKEKDQAEVDASAFDIT